MSIEDLNVSAIDADQAVTEFSSEFQADDQRAADIEMAQATDNGASAKSDRLPAETAAVGDRPKEIVPDQNNIARLPANVTVDEIRVEGANLILVQADGTEVTVINGALRIPTFIIGEVEVPQQVLLAVLEQDGVNVAAGPDGSYSATSSGPQSSGGNFEDSLQQSTQEAGPLAELLANTEFDDPNGDGNGLLFDDTPIITETALSFISETANADGTFESQTINGIFGFVPGADTGQIASIAYVNTLNIDEPMQTGIATALTSGGVPVVVTVSADGLTLTGTAGGEVVFTLTVTNTATGAFTFQQLHALDHPDQGQRGADDLLRLQFTYTVTDKDGDTVIGNASIDIRDDGPVASTGASSTVEDEAVNGGNNEPGDGFSAAVTGVSLNINWGADSANAGGLNDRSVAFTNTTVAVSGASSTALTSLGLAVSTVLIDGVLVGYTGATAPTSVTGEGSANVVFFASVSDIANGSYDFTLVKPLDHAATQGENSLSLTFNYTATDSDGDTSSNTFTVNIIDDVPVSSGDVTSSTVLDDEAQSVFAGNNTPADGVANEKVATGAAGSLFTAGSDGVTSVTISNGAFNVIYKNEAGFAQTEAVTWGAGVATADGTTTFTAVSEHYAGGAAVLVIKADGSYSLTVNAPVAHPTAGVAEENTTISIGFTVTDGDGDTASGTLNVNVNDDTPVATVSVTASTVLDDEAQSVFAGNNTPADGVANEKVATGAAGSLFTAGSDGVTSVTISNGAFNVIYKNEAGFAQTEAVIWGAGVATADGTTTFTAVSEHYAGGAAVLVIKADGSYSLTVNAPVAHPAAAGVEGPAEENTTISIGFTVTDGDGDTASGTLNVNVNDDTPVATVSVTASTVLDDEAQSVFAGNNTPADGVANEKVATGAAGSLFTAGSDGVTSVTISNGAFNVIYKNEAGFAQTEAVTWGAGVATADGTTTFTAVSEHYAGGAAVLVIRADGSYSLTVNAPVAHPAAAGVEGPAEENTTISIGFTVTDGDGDTASGTLNVNVNDDTPVATVSVTASTVLDDEAQSVFAGNNTPADGVANEKVATGAAGSLFTAGSDGVTSVTISNGAFNVIYKNEAGFAQTEAVTWGAGVATADGTTTFTAVSEHYAGGAAVLVIKADGSYSLTVNAPVAHPTAGVAEENTTISIGFTVTDGDGDTASGTLNVNVNDDTPVATVSVTASTVLDDEAQSVFAGNNTPADGVANEKVATGAAGSLFTAGSDGVTSVTISNGAFNVIYKNEAGFAQTEAVTWGAGVATADGTTTFTAVSEHYAGGAAVLVIRADGSYSLTVNAPVAHPAAAGVEGPAEENTTISIGFTVTDGDGDTASGTLNVNVNDDTPVATVSVTASTVLDDEAQSVFAGNNTPADGVANEKVATGAAGSLFTAGSDGVTSVTISNGAFNVIYKNEAGFAQTEAVTWGAGVATADGTTTFTAVSEHYAGGAAVLVIRADGSYSLTVNAPVAHPAAAGVEGPAEENTTISIGFTVTDGDGDTASGTLNVNVNDDTPVATVSVTASTVLDDEAQSVFAGNNTPADGVANEKVATGAAGSLFTAGSDGVTSVTISNGAFNVIYKNEAGFAQTEAVTWGAGVATADGTTTFTAVSEHYAGGAAVLVIRADGSYSLTVNAPVAHPAAAGVEGPAEENTTISIGFTVTDGDGDTASGTLNVNVNDDAPVAKIVEASRVLDDEAQSEFTPTNPGSNLPFDATDTNPNYKTVSGGAGILFTAGADGVKSVAIAGPAFDVVYKNGLGFAQTEAVAWGAGVVGTNGSTTFTATSINYPLSEGGAAVLVIRPDGSYTFTLNAPVAHGLESSFFEENETLSFGFTVTDGDGDTATGKLKIEVDDDTPTPVASVVFGAATLDDEAQSLFTPVNPGGAGDVSVNVGSTSGGAGSLFKMGADGLGSLAVDLPGFSVIAKTANGFATTESVTWSEGVRSAGGVTTYTATSGSYAGGAAVLVIKADGSYEFILHAPVAHAFAGTFEDNKALIFGYTAKDGDGDTAIGVLTISVNDDTPVATVSVTASTALDDDALAGGNAGGVGDVANATVATGPAGTLFTAGADGLASITLTAAPAFSVVYKDVNGFAQTESVSWSAAATSAGGTTTWTATSTHYGAGTPAAVLVIKADGSYSLTVNAPVAHAAAGTTEENAALTFGYTVKDGDGDTATGSLTVNVNDDTPVSRGNVTASTVLDDEAQTVFPANPGSGLLGDVSPDVKTVSGAAGSLFSMGADGFKAISLTPPAFGVIYKDAQGFAQTESVSWSAATTSAGGTTTWTATSTNYPVGTPAAVLVIKTDGSYTFSINAPVAHSVAFPGTEENAALKFSYTVTDGDGDTAAGSLTVNVNDDTPRPVASIVIPLTVLDDEAQSVFLGNSGSGFFGDVSPDVKTVSGGAGALFSMGSDGLGSIALSLPGFDVVYKDGNGFAQTESVGWGAGVRSADGTTTWTATSANYGAGAPAAILVIKADGSYSFSLGAPVAHAVGFPLVEENAGLTIGYTVTDGDGDQAGGFLTVRVNDDTPVAANVTPSTVLDDEAQVVFTPVNTGGTNDVAVDIKTVSGGAGTLFSMGSDGLASIALNTPTFNVVYKDANGFAQTEAVTWSAGVRGADGTTTWTATSGHYLAGTPAAVLVIKADGSYSFNLNAPVAHATPGTSEESRNLDFTYTVTDGDGDSANARLRLSVNDDTPVSKGAIVASTGLDDDALAGGNAGGVGDVANATVATGPAGTLFTAGADGLASITLTAAPALGVVYKDVNGFAQTESVSWSAAATSAGGTTTWTATSTHYGAGTPAAILVIKADGSYSLTVNAPVAHAAAGTTEENAALTFGYTVKDGDGDAATGSLTVNVNDDTPVSRGNVTASTVLDDEAQTVFPANPGSGLLGDVSPDVKTVSGAAGSLFSMGADGFKAISLTPPAFGVIYKDAQGFAQTESVSWSAATTSAGGTTTWTATSTNYPVGTPAAVLVIKTDGSYTFSINAPVAHSVAFPGTEENAALKFSYTVTDGDGDTAAGSLTVNVNDDTPRPVASIVIPLTVLDDEAQSVFLGNSGSGFFGDVSPDVKTVSGGAGALFSMGSDGLGSIALSLPGFDVVYKDGNGFAQTESVGWGAGVRSADGTTTWTATSANYGAGAPAAILVIKADGSYSFSLGAPVAHAVGFPLVEENAGLTIGYTVTDGDGDQAGGFLTVRVNDDTPVAANVTPSTVLDDEAQVVFTPVNTGGTNDVAVDIKTVSGGAGTLFSMGSDGLASIALNTPTFNVVYKDANGFAQTEAVTWSAGVRGADGTTTWTATSGHYLAGTPAAVLVIKADGSYSFNLNAPVAHATPGTSEESRNLDFTYTVTDGDGDSANARLRLSVNDDTPVSKGAIVASTGLDDDALAGGNAGGVGDVANATVATGPAGTLFTAGADGLASITLTAAPAFSVVYKDVNGFAQTESVSWSAAATSAGGTTTWTATSTHYGAGTPAAILVIKADGSYSLTVNAPVAHAAAGTTEENAALTFGYTVKDGDGDAATGSLTVNVNDDTPTIPEAGTQRIGVNDDALPGGNPEAGDKSVATGTLSHSFGADGGSLSWQPSTLPTGGYTSQVNGNTFEVFQTQNGVAVKVFGVVLDPATGAYTVTQFAPINHPTGNGEQGEGFNLNYRVTDGDGDYVSSFLRVVVGDDVPVAAGPAQTGTLYESSLPLVSSTFGSLNINIGADKHNTHVEIGTSNGAPVINTGLTSDGVALQYIVRTTNGVDQELVAFKQGDSAGAANPVFIVAVLHNGSFAATLYQNLDHAPGNGPLALTMSARVYDGDGDYVDQAFTINVADDVPVATGAAQTGTLSEAGLPLVSSTFGSLNIDIGSDNRNTHVEIGMSNGAPVINTGLTSDGVALQYLVRTTNGVDQELVAFKQGDLAGAANPVFIVAVLHPGSFAATLYQNLDHAPGNGPLALNMSARVYDGDGDYVDQAFTINIADDVPVILGTASASNLLANGDFKAGDWSHAESWGTWTTEDIGWKIEGTATGQADVRLERIASGYNGMTTSNSAPMVDLGATPGNVAISQTLTGLVAGKTYQVSFEVGSPSPGSSGLQVYWNGELVQTVAVTNAMTVINVNLPVLAGTAGTITFKETGDASDNTGTYLANIGLHEAGAVAVPVVSGSMSENETITVPFVEGTHYGFGADNLGHIDVGTASIAGPTGISLQAPAITYVPGSGFVITPGTAFDALGKGEIAKMTIPYTVIDGDGDKVVGSVVVTVTGTNDIPVIDLDTAAAGNGVAMVVHEQMPMHFGQRADLSDVDSPNLQSMTLKLGNILNGVKESLALSTWAAGVASTAGLHVDAYDSTTGILKITGSASVATYESILKNIGYVNNDDNTTAGDRTVTVVVNDGIANSVEQIATLHVTPVNDAPTLEGGTMTAVVAEGGSFVLTSNELKYHDWDDDAAGVTFFVSNVLHGTITNNGHPATSFTGAELEAGLIRFNHDGSEGSAASFNVMVEDGNEDQGGPAPVVLPFNLTVTPVNDGAAPITLTDTTQTAGAPKVGDVLQVMLGSDPDGDKTNVVYHWLRGGVDTGATGSTYTLGASDTGHAISVRAAYTDGQNFNEIVTSAATSAVVTNNTAPVAGVDYVVTDIDLGAAINIPDWVLLLNDTDADGNPLTIVGAGSAVGGTVADGAGVITFKDTGNAGGSFAYNVNDGTATATGTVNVTRDGTGNLDGQDSRNDILIGDAGDSDLYGLGGNDVLIGNAGDDDLHGGTGNDTYVFGLNDGSDDISETSGTDRIVVAAGAVDLGNLYAYDSNNATSDGDLVLEIGNTVVDVDDHFASGQTKAVELINFMGGSVNGYQLGTGDYRISTLDPSNSGGSRNVDLSASSADNLIAGEYGSRNTIAGGSGNDLIFGGGTNDNLQGGGGKDYLFGEDGNDVINGGAENDVIVGGAGQDTLTGGTGADTFVWGSEARDDDNADHITDYNFTEGDKINLQSLITSITNGTVADYVRVRSNGSGDLLVQVDLNGTAGSNNNNWRTIYTLDGKATSGIDSVRFHFAGQNYTITDTGVVALAADPIILDLDHNGFALSSIENGVTFDINADGKADKVAWTSTDGILAYDVDGNGKIDNGSEIFTPSFAGGNHAGGVAALATLDSNGDGKIDADDDAFSKLSIWVDANNNGISDAGELSSLADNHVASISLGATPVDGLEDGQSVLAEGTFTFDNGSNGHYIEVGFDTITGDGSFGTAGDDILAGGLAHMTMTGGAGADTFVLDADAFKGIALADVIADYKDSEGDVLDVSSLLTSLLGHEASEADALANVKTTVNGADTVVSVNDNGAWHDVAVLQDYTSTVKVLYDDDHNTTSTSHSV